MSYQRQVAAEALSEEHLKKFRAAFDDDPKNRLVQNMCTKYDPFEVCVSRSRLQDSHHVFQYKVEQEGKPVTNQKSSGRCWLFAALNVMRIHFMKAYNLEEFEFSPGYLFFWDKVEKCYYFLNSIVQAAYDYENIDGRLISFLLKLPVQDGGQWDMLVNIVNKYGVMPKQAFPESYSCERSREMNQILRSKLREYAKVVYEAANSDMEREKVFGIIETQMSTLYRIIGIFLGIPNDVFTWNYYDKDKNYHSIGPITPREFYNNYVKPVFNVDDKVCIVSDPRPTNPYGNVYTVNYLGNMVNGRQCVYNNQPIEVLIDLAKKSIKNGEPVWFGCDVMKRYSSNSGMEDLEIHDFTLLLGTDVYMNLPKADRLLYGDSTMTHAMVFTGVSTNDADEATKFRVENSWGEDKGHKGYLTMTSDWFKEFGFEVVVDKKFVPEEILNLFKNDLIRLPAWDPMGTLAH